MLKKKKKGHWFTFPLWKAASSLLRPAHDCSDSGELVFFFGRDVGHNLPRNLGSSVPCLNCQRLSKLSMRFWEMLKLVGHHSFLA